MGVSDSFYPATTPGNTKARDPFFDVAEAPAKQEKKALDPFLEGADKPKAKKLVDPFLEPAAPAIKKDKVDIAQGQDPYFNPPKDAKPTRARPFLKGSEVDPRPQQPAPADGAPAQPVVQHPTYEEKWNPPKNPAKFSDRQPYSGGQSGGQTDIAALDMELRMKGSQLLRMRDTQRGTNLASAMITGTGVTGYKVMAEPITKLVAKAKANPAAAEMPWLSSKSWESGKRAFTHTLVSGTLLTADEAMRDRVYGDKYNTWGSQSLTVPLAMALGKGKLGKGIAVPIALASGHVADWAVPAPDWVPECVKHFTWADGLALSLAASSDKKGLAKAGLMTLAFAGGNLVEYGLTPTSPGKVEQTALRAVDDDMAARSYDSMTEAVNKFKEVGQRNEIIVEHNLARLVVESNRNFSKMSREEKLASHRNTIVVAKALGDHHLEKGNRVAVNDTSTPTYILEGRNLDLGGDALAYLGMARRSVNSSKTFTELMQNTFAKDKRVTAQEVQELERVGADIDRSIGTILGKHDIQGAVDDLIKFIDIGRTTSGPTVFNKEAAFYHTFITDINKKLARNLPKVDNPDGTPNADARMISAKLLRDQAVAQIALATYKMDAGNVSDAAMELFGTPQGRQEVLYNTQIPKQFDGAMEAIALSEQYAPDNPDLPELKALALKLKERIDAARQK